jgi:hypothetical protein
MGVSEKVNEHKEVFILSYGCDLDHSNINFLVKERLMPFSHKKSPNETDICVQYEVFDVNRKKHKQLYYGHKFYINKIRLEAFLYSLSKLKGNHVYANPLVRGHAYALIDGVEYTGRIYESFEDAQTLVFIDEESINNIPLREKLPSLRKELHFLKTPINIPFEESDLLVAKWVKSIINEIK